MPSAVFAGLLLVASASALRRNVGKDLHNGGSFSDVLGDVLAHSSSCDLCGGQQWLFVMGTGRSGSTTVLDMINAVPGFYLSGENFGLFERLSTAFNDIELGGFGEVNGTAFAHMPISRQAVLCGMQEVTRAAIGASSAAPGTHTIGFKEIRWTVDALKLMNAVFPCARYIINTRRDVEEQMKAIHWHGVLLSQVRNLTSMVENFQYVHAKRSTLIQLEDFSVQRFNELLEWLGVSDCKYTSVCHSAVGGTYATDKNKLQVLGTCKMTQNWAGTRSP